MTTHRLEESDGVLVECVNKRPLQTAHSSRDANNAPRMLNTLGTKH